MWLTMLKQAVERSSKAAVAMELGVSRTTISLVVDGKYPAKTDKIEVLVLNTYGRVICPFSGDEITLAVCKKHHTSAVPTSSPRAMKHWRTCQGCEHNSTKKGQ